MEEKKKKTLPSLPEELIIQILLRLPVKFLIRFKCVCKSWFSLISDPHFTNSHFQLSAATPTRRVLFIVQSQYVETESIDLEASLNSDSSSTSLYLNFMFSESGYELEIKGSCRGFILLHGYFNIYLWNPSTGIHKKLPLSRYGCTCSTYTYNRNYFYGFGYDHLTDDYLLVSLSQDPKLANTKHFEFFSLRANTWKEIEGDFPYCNASDDPKRVGTLFNGAIYWYGFRHDLRYDVIVAFDLMERKLLEMGLPDDADFETKDCDVWVFGDFLSLWAMGNDNTTEIWVMKEYKVHSSWTKILVLSINCNYIDTDYFSLICSTKSGDIIGSQGGTRLVKYNDRGELLEHLSYSYSPHGFQAAMYTESLLSLPADSEQA
ncbi:F-box/kelch-repeat protein [Trifolium pratense]|uniref:F-box/kelch-repeat protein n=1 Tax=Trifolium pratense TaxID=57577 RepID=A0A2K3P0G9_TRIPR|nr:F-box/kelch-repeat protein [Trifolium pratense]